MTLADSSYAEIFRARGAAYRRAMQAQPDARREDLQLAVKRARLSAAMTLVDAPAGGGELARYLPPGCLYLGHEPCAALRDDEREHFGVST